MPLVTTKGMLTTAHTKNYAIGAFNANNLEMAKGIVEAAEEENAPLIVEVSQGGVQHGGIEEMSAAIRALATKADIPVALHFDHGTDIAHNIKCLRAGFTSLMFDGSRLSYEENVAKTKEIVRIAHTVGIPVEAELGKVPKDASKVSDGNLEDFLTEPLEAKDFVEKTKIDFLAVAVGSMHKMKNQSVEVDIERLEEIKKVVDIPLVLHGSSGVRDQSDKKAIKAGISKINVHTHLAKNFTNEVREVLKDNPDMVDLRKYLKPGRDALKIAVKEKLEVFNVIDKAQDIINVKVKEPSDLEFGEIVE